MAVPQRGPVPSLVRVELMGVRCRELSDRSSKATAKCGESISRSQSMVVYSECSGKADGFVARREFSTAREGGTRTDWTRCAFYVPPTLLWLTGG